MSEPALPHLFQPIAIGGMTVRNRIMMPGMSAGMALDNEGRVTPAMIAYYRERAASRPGLIAIGASAVVPPLAARRHPLALYDDQYIPSLQTLVDAVHQYDTKFGVQLWDGGMQTGGTHQLTPSGVGINAKAVFDGRKEAPVPKILTTADVEQVVEYFAGAALRCAQAGFDFIEIHAGHGYLISNFMTPYFNRRSDKYGGSFENRVRFLLDILRAVKLRVGAALAVGVKINGDDFLERDGWTLPEACRLGPLLQADGADYISVTAGVMGAKRLTVPPLYEKQGCFADMAEEVRRHVTIPVATVGRIKSPVMANELVRDGKVDVVCMGRAMIADPEIVEKARRGLLDDIRPCLAECRGCIDQEMRGIKSGSPGVASCVVNPRVGRESVIVDVRNARQTRARRVLVIGGGLAGLEAARQTAFAGHHVLLCERRARLGGQLRLAAMIPGRQEIADILPWYERQLGQYGVEVRLNTEVDARLLATVRPDVVFVATGSIPQVPQNMLDGVASAERIRMLMVDDLLESEAVPGDNILVVGGDQIGLQVADYLSEGGRTVCVAEADSHFGAKLAANDRWYLVARTMAKQVRRFKNVRDIVIDGEERVWLATDTGKEYLPDIDTIVFSSERRSVQTLAELAKAQGYETHIVGDASDVASEDSGTILSNVAQAYDRARSI